MFLDFSFKIQENSPPPLSLKYIPLPRAKLLEKVEQGVEPLDRVHPAHQQHIVRQILVIFHSRRSITGLSEPREGWGEQTLVSSRVKSQHILTSGRAGP